MRKRKGRNRRRKLKLYSRSSLVLLLTILFVAIFVAPIFTEQFSEVNVAQGTRLWQETLDASTLFVQLFCLLFALTISRVVWIISWSILCVSAAINSYAYSAFHTQVSKYAIEVMLEPKAREAANLLTVNLGLMLACGAIMSILGIVLMRREQTEPRNRRIAFVALALTVALVSFNQGSMSSPYPPFNILTSSYQFAYDHYMRVPEKRTDISKLGGSWSSKGKTPLVVVVVIGESARADHFGINGYNRDTTPLLQQRKNLINFRNTISCGVWTNVSVPCLMTRATRSDMSAMYKETSFISIFRQLGFHTSWLSTQGKTSFYYPVTPISREAENTVMLEEQQVLDNTIKDEQLLPLLDKELENTKQPQLIVLHTYGSHWQYAARYTKPFELFQPVCETTLSRQYSENAQLNEIRNCYSDQEALINSYDNSILYTDYILDEVIKRLETKNALFVYTSDHGESLGEGGRFLHGHENAMDNRGVPMFWWASDEFIVAHGERWESLMKKSMEPSSHDVIFHSVLDCADISSPVVVSDLSLCHIDTPPAPEPVVVSPIEELRPVKAASVKLITIKKKEVKEEEDEPGSEDNH